MLNRRFEFRFCWRVRSRDHSGGLLWYHQNKRENSNGDKTNCGSFIHSFIIADAPRDQFCLPDRKKIRNSCLAALAVAFGARIQSNRAADFTGVLGEESSARLDLKISGLPVYRRSFFPPLPLPPPFFPPPFAFPIEGGLSGL